MRMYRISQLHDARHKCKSQVGRPRFGYIGSPKHSHMIKVRRSEHGPNMVRTRSECGPTSLTVMTVKTIATVREQMYLLFFTFGSKKTVIYAKVSAALAFATDCKPQPRAFRSAHLIVLEAKLLMHHLTWVPPATTYSRSSCCCCCCQIKERN